MPVVLAICANRVNNGSMGYPAKPASSVLYVSELDRSVTFYRDLFECKVTLRSAEAALLLTAEEFQLYIIERGKHAQRHPSGLGYHLLMWATESSQGLERLRQALHDTGSYVDTHEAGGVTFVEGRDPDGLRVIIAHPDPAQQPRSVFDSHLYT
jgi:catechol 2,3-dioxygenase-like lactoylglutathione lyase family enzyme